MGCLSRIGCLVVVAGAGVVGWWLYGERLPSVLSRMAGTVADNVSAATGGRDARTPGAVADSARAPDSGVAWATVGAAAPRQANILAALSKRDGPAYVTLGAGDLASLLATSLPGQLPSSVSNLQVAIRDDQLLVRAALDVSDIAGDGTLGRLLGIALAGRDSVRVAGPLELIRPGLAQLVVDEMRLKGVDVPPRLIPAFIGAMRRGPRVEGLASHALAIPLPRSVGDLRVAKGRLTLYKAEPTP